MTGRRLRDKRGHNPDSPPQGDPTEYQAEKRSLRRSSPGPALRSLGGDFYEEHYFSASARGEMLVSVRSTFSELAERHYLGPAKSAGFAWRDDHGVMVFAAPRGRNLPPRWLELVRWCLSGEPNAGTQQWASFAAFARNHLVNTTVVSYSDPAQGHTGALYRACNWLWAPTWHRLRPPPSGNGSWTDGKAQGVKDRWIYPLSEDDERGAVLKVHDESICRRMGWAQYREPTWHRGRFDPRTGGGDWKRFASVCKPSHLSYGPAPEGT